MNSQEFVRNNPNLDLVNINMNAKFISVKIHFHNIKLKQNFDINQSHNSVMNWWQVAQRATIAHLSLVCQGQILFQENNKWAMEIRGPKSNSSEPVLVTSNFDDDSIKKWMN